MQVLVDHDALQPIFVFGLNNHHIMTNIMLGTSGLPLIWVKLWLTYIDL